MKSKLAIAITSWGWLLFVVWLSYDYATYPDRWIIHIIKPAYDHEIHAFHVLIFLVPFIYTLLGYLVHEREKLLIKVEESEKRYRDLSLHDELTSLYNRRGFYFLAEQQIKVVNRTKQKLLLMYIDVDKVKFINDNWGHHEGDKALIATADILRKLIRQSDIIARISGDEFAALVTETSEALPQMLSERLQESCSTYNATSNSFKLSLSAGFTRYDPAYSYSLDDLLRFADNDMYKNKQRKNQ